MPAPAPQPAEAAPAVDAPVPPSVLRTRRARAGGKRRVPPETIAAIVAEREKFPNMPQKTFCQHLYDTGIYRQKRKSTGELVPVDYPTVYHWLKQAGWPARNP